MSACCIVCCLISCLAVTVLVCIMIQRRALSNSEQTGCGWFRLGAKAKQNTPLVLLSLSITVAFPPTYALSSLHQLLGVVTCCSTRFSHKLPFINERWRDQQCDRLGPHVYVW